MKIIKIIGKVVSSGGGVEQNKGNCLTIRSINFHFFHILIFICIFIESDESPGIYLRDDYLGGPTELRAPTAERAALFLDAALAGRTSSIYEPALIFTLHVYQYSLGAGKGGGKYLEHENCYLCLQCTNLN